MAVKSTQFSSAVETYAKENGGSLLSACIQVAENLEIDEEKIPRLVSESLRQKLEIEAINDRALKSKPSGDSESLSAWI